VDVIYWLIPLSLVILTGAVWLFFWAVKSGQYEDLDSAGMDILFNNDDELDISIYSKKNIESLPLSPLSPLSPLASEDEITRNKQL